jgi:SHS2 domain-containing protein
MKKYQVLEHRADLKIKIFGKNLKELFENAIIAMFESANYRAEIKTQNRKHKVEISSLDLPSLLVDFLSEVLYLSETKKEVYQKIDFEKLTEKELKGILIGKKLKRIGTHIKGVTYHDLVLRQEKDGKWQATILFDI